MSDVAARFKAFLWANHAVDPQSVDVTIGAGGRIHSFGVDGNSHHTRAMGFGSGAHAGKTPYGRVIEFEGYKVPERDFDGTGGPVAGMTIR